MQCLTDCCGANPKMKQPDEETLGNVRRALEVTLKKPKFSFDKHHAASNWRFELVRAVQEQCNDPDTDLPRWLEHGFPMGISPINKQVWLIPRSGSGSRTHGVGTGRGGCMAA